MYLFGDIGDGGDEVGRKEGVADAPFRRDQMLHQGVALGLHHTTLNLPFDEIGVERAADVVGGIDLDEADEAGFDIHLNFYCLGDITIGDIWRTDTGLGG